MVLPLGIIITIAILSLLNWIGSIGRNWKEKGTLDFGIFHPAILVLVLWVDFNTLAIVTLCIAGFLALMSFMDNE